MAARGLAAMKPPPKEAVPDLRRALTDVVPEVRWAAIQALEAIGPDAAAAIPDLVSFLRHYQERESEAAVAALGVIGAPAIPAVKELLTADEPGVRVLAAQALARMRNRGDEVVPVLISILEQDKNAAVRSHVAVALSEHSPRLLNPFLPRLRKIKDRETDAGARGALELVIELVSASPESLVVPELLPVEEEGPVEEEEEEPEDPNEYIGWE